jgi:MinD-like ATPase involved in chromosome partitioning or flagellar assembly
LKTFDEIVPELLAALRSLEPTQLASVGDLIVNRDLTGRIRLVADEGVKHVQDAESMLQELHQQLVNRLGVRAYPFSNAVLYEDGLDAIRAGAPAYKLEEFPNVTVLDRLISESNWASFEPETTQAARVVFFSIKGGVGRSTALAAAAWALAQAGKRVLVLDLDLESPGLSSAILPPDKQPKYGVTDWLIEDLLDNGEEVFEAMVATSDLSRDGEIYVVPAHGANPGEYIAKLGRAWMSKALEDGRRESWGARLKRLLNNLETRWKPDVILIDSRAGIDEIASSCITELGANMVLLFAIEGTQTWSGYKILFEHWRRMGVAKDVRERIQVVSALTPEIDRAEYLSGLRDRSYDLFSLTLYDEVEPGDTSFDEWHFETSDQTAPHYPWEIKWHRSFAGLQSLHGRIVNIDAVEVDSIFGSVIGGIKLAVE